MCSWVKVAAGWGPNSTENTENYETIISSQDVTGTAFLSEAGLETPICDSWIAGTSCRPIFAPVSRARSEHTGSQPFSSSALLHLKEKPLPGELGGNRRKVTDHPGDRDSDRFCLLTMVDNGLYHTGHH